MTSWNPETLAAIAVTDDLHIAPFRADGVTYGTLTWIWSVVVDGELYVRAYNGADSSWYRSAMSQKAGRIRAAGHLHEVTFEPADPSVTSAVDSAYAAKYADSPYVQGINGAKQQAATVRIVENSVSA